MNIHHTHKKQAEKIGVILSVEGEEIQALWPDRGASVRAATAPEALQMIREVQNTIRDEEQNMDDIPPRDPNEGEEDERDGDEGEEGSEEEDSGEDQEVAEGEEKVSSSVVKEKYRLKYAEEGHPSHCGDWLATILKNLTHTKEGADIGRFQAICAMNDVDMAKYRTSGNGWQGRFRMTGRNLLAKKLMDREFLFAPGMNGEQEEYPVPQEWKEARNGKKAEVTN